MAIGRGEPREDSREKMLKELREGEETDEGTGKRIS